MCTQKKKNDSSGSIVAGNCSRFSAEKHFILIITSRTELDSAWLTSLMSKGSTGSGEIEQLENHQPQITREAVSIRPRMASSNSRTQRAQPCRAVPGAVPTDGAVPCWCRNVPCHAVLVPCRAVLGRLCRTDAVLVPHWAGLVPCGDAPTAGAVPCRTGAVLEPHWAVPGRCAPAARRSGIFETARSGSPVDWRQLGEIAEIPQAISFSRGHKLMTGDLPRSLRKTPSRGDSV